MPCSQVVRMCQPQCSSAQVDSGSKALNRSDIQKSVVLDIPKGGSISFEHVAKNGLGGSISDLPSGIPSFTQYNGQYGIKKMDDGRHLVEMTGEIKSLNAVIRYADGKVFWSGDLMKVGKGGEEKEELRQKHPAKKGPEDSQKEHKPPVDEWKLRLPPARDPRESLEKHKDVQRALPPASRRQLTVTSPSISIEVAADSKKSSSGLVSNVQNKKDKTEPDSSKTIKAEGEHVSSKVQKDKTQPSVTKQRNTTGYQAYTGTINEMSLAQAEEFMTDFPNVAVVLVVSTDWCGPCKRYKEDHLTPFADTLGGNKNIAIIRINSDHFPEVTTKYGLSGVPNTMFKGIGDTGVRMVYENNLVYPYVAVGPQTREQVINQLHETQREFDNRNRR